MGKRSKCSNMYMCLRQRRRRRQWQRRPKENANALEWAHTTCIVNAFCVKRKLNARDTLASPQIEIHIWEALPYTHTTHSHSVEPIRITRAIMRFNVYRRLFFGIYFFDRHFLPWTFISYSKNGEKKTDNENNERRGRKKCKTDDELDFFFSFAEQTFYISFVRSLCAGLFVYKIYLFFSFLWFLQSPLSNVDSDRPRSNRLRAFVQCDSGSEQRSAFDTQQKLKWNARAKSDDLNQWINFIQKIW